MTLKSLGSLPGGQLHFGLNKVVNLLEIRLGEVNGIVSGIGSSLDVIAGADLDLGSIGADFDLSPSVIREIALGLPSIAIDGNVQLGLDIAWVNRAVARMRALLGDFQRVLGLGGIQAWAYKGASNKYGQLLAGASRGGFADVAPGDDISALVLASSSATDWIQAGALLNTGWGDLEVETTDSSGLTRGEILDLGSVPASSLFLGLSAALPAIQLELSTLADAIGELQLAIPSNVSLSAEFSLPTIALALKAAIEASLSLQFQPPSFSLELGIDLNLELVLALGIQAILRPIVVDLRAAINGDGIQAWSYRGPCRGLGPAFSAVTTNGIAGGAPGDRAYGLVLASGSTADWADIGSVMKVSAD